MTEISNWNVLIVDDEPDNLGVLQLVLSFHKATVHTADSAKQCLELLEKDSPSVILVDIQMPHMSGIELLHRLRSDDRWRRVPVIAVSARAMDGDPERGLAAGFDGYITKPIAVATFADEIKAIIDAKGKQ